MVYRVWVARMSSNVSFDAIFQESKKVTGKYEAYSVLKSLCSLHQFQHFSLIIFSREMNPSLASNILITNLPEEFVAEYDRDNLLANNLTIDLLRTSVAPVTWDIRSVKLDRRKVERQRTIDLLSRYGLLMGANFALNDSRCNHGVLVYYGQRQAPNLTELAKINLVTSVVFDRLGAQPNIHAPEMNFRLGDRELQILSWASAGKTSAEIAVILDLSEHTVNQYIASCIQKLDATNRVHAVARAIRLGLIE